MLLRGEGEGFMCILGLQPQVLPHTWMADNLPSGPSPQPSGNNIVFKVVDNIPLLVEMIYWLPCLCICLLIL